jgi:gamma-butyrobetaine dioxygenase
MPTLDITETPQPGVHVTMDDGLRIDLHPLWLRERCQAVTSIDQRTRQRIVDLAALPSDVSITGCQWSTSGELVVRFSDHHESRFDPRELLTQATITPLHDGLPAPIPWTAGLAKLPQAPWPSTSDSDALRNIISQFLQYGFVILRDVPCTDLKVCEIGATFGVVRETQFGRHIDIRSNSHADDMVHSPLYAASHTGYQ